MTEPICPQRKATNSDKHKARSEFMRLLEAVVALMRSHSHLRRWSVIVGAVSIFPKVLARRSTHSMSASNPEVTFTPRASGDGTWYVEVASPAIACEEVGDFRSKASAEAWILDILRTYAMSGTSGSGACSANAKTVHGDAI